jgi:subtilase family protein
VDPIEVQRPGMLNTHIRSAMLAAAGVLLALVPPAAAAGSVAPLPTSAYLTRPACPAPAPGHASCLAVELVPKSGEARAHTHPLGMTSASPLEGSNPKSGAYGLRPADLRAAYFPSEFAEAPASKPQTIALVDAYNDPQAEADLGVYDKEFGVAACTEANGCFEKVNQRGEHGSLPFPTSEAEREAELRICENPYTSKAKREVACDKVEEAEGWAVEISTDIETAHAICQRNCHIVLVEANSDSYEDLEAAEETAVRLGGEKTTAVDTEVSNSWGGSEPVLESAAFNHPGTVIAAAAGDDGYLNWTDAAEAEEAKEEYYEGADYPAASPHVVAVGGTRLGLSSSGAWKEETVWNDDPRGGEENYGAGGGGCSSQFEAQKWQREVKDWANVGCEDRRAVADIAADGDPYSGVAVYDSVPDVHEEEVGNEIVAVNTPLYWWPIGGTSVASPIVASMFALAGGSHGVEYPAKTLYEHLETGLLHPVTEGGNGECDNFYGENPTTHTTCGGSLEPLSSRFAFDCGKGVLICNAGPGYNGPAGVGTPDGVGAFQPGSEAAVRKARAEEEAVLKAEAEVREKAEVEAAAKRDAEEKAKQEQKAEEEALAKNAREAKEAESRKAAEAQLALEKAEQVEAEKLAAQKIQEEALLGGGLNGGSGGSASNTKGGSGSASQSGSSSGNKATGSPASKGSHHSHHHKRRRKHRRRRARRHRR